MAEFYQETLLVKAEVVDGKNTFGSLKNWRNRRVQFETVKFNCRLLRISFCSTLGNSKRLAPSIFIDPTNNFRLKRGVTIVGKKWHVLCGEWRNSEDETCEISFAFDSEINFNIHRNIVESFLNNLIGSGEQSEASSAPTNIATHLESPKELRDHLVVYDVHEIHFIGRPVSEPSSPDDSPETTAEIETIQNGHPRKLSLKKCLRRFGWTK